MSQIDQRTRGFSTHKRTEVLFIRQVPKHGFEHSTLLGCGRPEGGGARGREPGFGLADLCMHPHCWRDHDPFRGLAVSQGSASLRSLDVTTGCNNVALAEITLGCRRVSRSLLLEMRKGSCRVMRKPASVRSWTLFGHGSSPKGSSVSYPRR